MTPNEQNQSHRRQGRHMWYPVLVTFASLALTLFAAYYAARVIRLQNQARLAAQARELQAAIQARMEAQIALLRGGTAFASAQPELTTEKFRIFVNGLRIHQKYAGLQGYGYTMRVLPREKAELERRMRQEVPDFRIWPEYERPEYHTIAFLEPHDRRNLAALGFDMFSEPTRRAAMERARDTGLAALSGPVTLVQEIEGPKQKGFLMYLPVYNDGDVPDTLEERRRQLRGFLYSPCRADDLFLGIFADYTHIPLAREIYDGATLNEEALLHRSGVQPGAQPHSSQSRIDLQLEVAGRLWTLVFMAQPGFVQASAVVPATLAGGLGLTLVLLYLTLGQARARREAEDTAARLKVSEQHLLEARTELQNYALLLEKKVAERTMELSKSLEDLERVMYHVAHDLRAPARAMGSFASLALEDSRKELTPASVDYLQRIRGGAERMDALVSDLLAYGRTAHMPLPLEEVSLEDRVEQALASVHANVQETGTVIHVDRPLPKVQANPGALTDVLRQLLTNAIKFAKPGTKPWVRIYAHQGEKVRLYVEDRGIGIRPEYHDRIFRIFERLHASDAYSGTGIGLALAHKAVERMGGSLGVDSTPGEGSRFWVELPCPDKNQPNPLKTG